MKKGTFPSEREWDHIRLFKGAQSTIRCRTWLLRNRSGGELLAALTIRFNPYNGRCGRWAQIMSAAALQKRCGHGTLLVQTTMAILKENSDVDVMVVYPSDNQKALQFWKKVGFVERVRSWLPEADLVPEGQGGHLLPEYDVDSAKLLPRLEFCIAR